MTLPAQCYYRTKMFRRFRSRLQAFFVWDASRRRRHKHPDNSYRGTPSKLVEIPDGLQTTPWTAIREVRKALMIPTVTPMYTANTGYDVRCLESAVTPQNAKQFDDSTLQNGMIKGRSILHNRGPERAGETVKGVLIGPATSRVGRVPRSLRQRWSLQRKGLLAAVTSQSALPLATFTSRSLPSRGSSRKPQNWQFRRGTDCSPSGDNLQPSKGDSQEWKPEIPELEGITGGAPIRTLAGGRQFPDNKEDNLNSSNQEPTSYFNQH